MLFEEQNDIVVEYSSEMRFPIIPHECVTLHHESLHLESLEKITSIIGGSVYGQDTRLKEEKHV